jgi:catechol 2,3-dioxygenase-like lactoylglutathione lyase family enzyme
VDVLRVGFVGIRTEAARATTAFFRDVLGLEIRRDDDQWGIAQLPTGDFDFVEVYGPDFHDERLAADDASVFVGFVVDDVVQAREEILRAGAEASEIVWAAEAFGSHVYDGFAWFFFRAPDGRSYVIQQVPEPRTG